MEYYAQGQRSPSSFARLKVSTGDSRGVLLSSRHPHEDWPIQHAVRSAALPMADTGLDEGMWQLSLHPTDGMEPAPGPYPERRGEPDCVYYLRTGLCGFGMSCRFNHPRNLAAIIARGRGEYPERVGQPECQYYLKTGTCKFGATCKYHHPRDKGGLTGRVQLNIIGLPFKMGEKECAYYMRTGSCKYGVTCKFHHPHPATAFMPVPSPLYATTGSPSTPLAQHYPAGMSSWPITRGPYLASPRLQGPTSFGPLLIPSQGIVSVAGWNAYQGTVAPLTPDGQQPSIGPGYLYSGAHQAESHGAGVQGSLGPYSPVSGAVGALTLQSQSIGGQKESIFPERPGQPECQYYMKTGDCKFGATCRFHHPKDRTTPSATCGLSPMGLPLRLGAPPCTYYTRYGICKFGPTCKFDHPLGDLSSSLSPSSLTEMTNVAYPAPMNTSFMPLSIPSDAPLDIARPVLASSKDLASVSSEFAAHDRLVSKENYDEGDGSVNLSSELSDTSLQAGQSLPVHVSTSVASISSLGSESQSDVVG